MTGALFVQTLVLTWLKNPAASLEELRQAAAALGVEITPQGVAARFKPQAASLLKEVLDAAVGAVVSAAEPAAVELLQRFNGVVLQDSSIINLPQPLAMHWRGCGDSAGGHQAALKLEVRLDVLNGTLYGPLLEQGRTADAASLIQSLPLPDGTLHIADLGYFDLQAMAGIAGHNAFFLSRLQAQTALFDMQGQPLDLLTLLQSRGNEVDMPVQLGHSQRLSVRLLAMRAPQEVGEQRRRRMRAEASRRQRPLTDRRLALADWTILVTNVPRHKLSLREAMVLARVRWQVELLFKLWKRDGRVDEWRSANPWRILCEVYAKLTAMVVQHWLLLTGCWAYPDRSMVKAARAVRDHALLLLYALTQLIDLSRVIRQIAQCLATSCRMNRRRQAPNTYQLLLYPDQGGLA
jgi:hypothetical protein